MKTGESFLAQLFAHYRADFKIKESTYHFSLGFRLQNRIKKLEKIELAYGFTLLQDLINKEKDKRVLKKLVEIRAVSIFSLYDENSPDHKEIINEI